VKVGTTTCRFALRDPGHLCVRRDGREAHGPWEDCFYEARAQTIEQGQVLRKAESAASLTREEAPWPT
jgi:hypothetical protein